MKRIYFLFLAALALAGCASTPPEQAIINDAATALGGADKIRAVNTLVLEVAGEQGNMGQNLTPDSPLPIFKVSEGRIAMDLAQGRYKTDLTRTPTFVTANTAPQKQVQGLDGDVAYNVPATGMPARASAEVAKDRRLAMYHHPIAAVRAALAQGAQLAGPRKDGNDDVVDITTSQGDKLTLYVDSGTKLPSKIVSMTANNTNWPLGDTIVETSFSEYTEVDGSKVPARIVSKTDKYTTSNFQVKTLLNGDAGDLSAPESAKSAAAPALTAMVTAEEASKGVWYLAGQSHHSVLVEFADYLALIEAPQNEVRVGAVLDKVKELKPDKPLRYVVNTHHHFDHSGGIRRAMAEDVTIITHEANKAFYEQIPSRPATLVPEKKAPKAAKVIGISDKYELKDSTRTVEIYPVPNPHSDSMLMVYFPAERLLVEADLYTPPAPNAPPPPGFPFAPSVVQAVQKLGLRPARLMPIHGFIVPYADLEAAARGAVKSSD